MTAASSCAWSPTATLPFRGGRRRARTSCSSPRSAASSSSATEKKGPDPFFSALDPGTCRDRLRGDGLHGLGLLGLELGVVVAVAQDAEVARDAAVGVDRDAGKDLLA